MAGEEATGFRQHFAMAADDHGVRRDFLRGDPLPCRQPMPVRHRQRIAFPKQNLFAKTLAAAPDQRQRHVDAPLCQMARQFPLGAGNQFEPPRLVRRAKARERCGDVLAGNAGEETDAQRARRCFRRHCLRGQMKFPFDATGMGLEARPARRQFDALVRAHEQRKA